MAGPGLAILSAIESDAVFAGNVISDDLETLVSRSPGLAGLDQAIAGLPLAEDAFGQQMFIAPRGHGRVAEPPAVHLDHYGCGVWRACSRTDSARSGFRHLCGSRHSRHHHDPDQ